MELTKEYFDGEFADKLSEKLKNTMESSFVTKEHFDKAVGALATKEEVKLSREHFDKTVGNLTTKEHFDKTIGNLVTKEHFNHTVGNLVTKEHFNRTVGGLTTKEHFDNTVKLLATQESVDELSQRVIKVEKTLNRHTNTLDGLATDVKKLTEDKIVSSYQFNQAKEHIEQLAKHTGLKLEY